MVLGTILATFQITWLKDIMANDDPCESEVFSGTHPLLLLLIEERGTTVEARSTRNPLGLVFGLFVIVAMFVSGVPFLKEGKSVIDDLVFDRSGMDCCGRHY